MTVFNRPPGLSLICSKMPTLGKAPFSVFYEVYEDMVEILLKLQVFLAENPEIEYLFCALKPACSSAMISSACGWSLFRKIFNMVLLGMLPTPAGL